MEGRGEKEEEAGREAGLVEGREGERRWKTQSILFLFGFKKKVGAGWQTAMYFSPIDLLLRLAFYLGNIPCVGCLMGKGGKE